MTAQQIVGSATRLFAIWLAITAVQAIGMAAEMREQAHAEIPMAPYLFAGGFLLAAVLLWLFPMVVAHKLVPRTKFDNVLQVPAHEALVVACVVLGLWLIVARVLPALAFYISILAFLVKNQQPVSTMAESHHISLLIGLIQLSVALVLILKARHLSAYILSQRPSDKAG